MKNKPTVIDLFCGAGGLSKGFEMAGFEIIGGIDFDKFSMETFKKNHPKTFLLYVDDNPVNIKDIDAKDFLKFTGRDCVDVIVGGPPCQGFSMAGRRDPMDPRNSLFMEFWRFVRDLNPKWFVMENVPGILTGKTSEGKFVKDIIKNEFERIGYKIEYDKLNSADYGVPQRRKRVIFIGTRTGKHITYPNPTHSNRFGVDAGNRRILSWVPVKKVLLPRNKIDKSFFHSSKMIEGFKKRKARNEKEGKGFGYQVLDPEKPSYTISARYWKDGSDALVKYSENEIRMLTPLEAARIQSFPDDFVFSGGKREQYKQIGNAVPPLLAKAVAEKIKTLL
jgi:DNA (cytosine-5)-methyltransferase 1